jgi:hypothetical protein
MDDLTAKLMLASAANAQLSNALWNAYSQEQAAHDATKKVCEEELEGLRERVQGKERDL